MMRFKLYSLTLSVISACGILWREGNISRNY